MGKHSFVGSVIGWSLILVIIVLCAAQVGLRVSWYIYFSRSMPSFCIHSF
jgi:hypothetical protein